MLAPPACAVAERFGCHVCVFAAGVISFAGFLLGVAFVNFVPGLYLALFLVGLGQSFSTIGALLDIAYLFPDRFSVAYGFVLFSNGLGLFVHPLALQMLFDEYGLRGAFAILGAISAHSCASGLMMTPTALEREILTDKQRNAKNQ